MDIFWENWLDVVFHIPKLCDCFVLFCHQWLFFRGHTWCLSLHTLPSFFPSFLLFHANFNAISPWKAWTWPLMTDLIFPRRTTNVSVFVESTTRGASFSFFRLFFSAFRAAKEFSAPPTFDIRQQGGPDMRASEVLSRLDRANSRLLSSPKQGHHAQKSVVPELSLAVNESGENRISIPEVVRARKTLRLCRIVVYTADRIVWPKLTIQEIIDHFYRDHTWGQEIIRSYSPYNRSLLDDRNQGQKRAKRKLRVNASVVVRGTGQRRGPWERYICHAANTKLTSERNTVQR